MFGDAGPDHKDGGRFFSDSGPRFAPS